MTAFAFFFHWLTLLVLPIWFVGLVNRTKAIWAGRKGQPLGQLRFDLARLLKKAPVYSETATWVFQASPLVLLSATLIAASIVPVFPGYSPVSFPYDFVVFAYLMALARIFLMLGALDTGGSFEGMGASRHAGYSALAEPALFLVLGSLAAATGETSFRELVALNGAEGWLLRFACAAGLFAILQIEAARAPVEDPSTHLKLTMIHEVMTLDHGGPELAAVQYASAVKMMALAGPIAALLNPFSMATQPVAAVMASGFLIAGLGAAVGLVESLMPRLRLAAIPNFAFGALILGALAVVLAVMRAATP